MAAGIPRARTQDDIVEIRDRFRTSFLGRRGGHVGRRLAWRLPDSTRRFDYTVSQEHHRSRPVCIDCACRHSGICRAKLACRYPFDFLRGISETGDRFGQFISDRFGAADDGGCSDRHSEFLRQHRGITGANRYRLYRQCHRLVREFLCRGRRHGSVWSPLVHVDRRQY